MKGAHGVVFGDESFVLVVSAGSCLCMCECVVMAGVGVYLPRCRWFMGALWAEEVKQKGHLSGCVLSLAFKGVSLRLER